ncbi:ferredoxin [Streptomyces sp. NPDC051572]|uniref:ferredoxin n=1 Tax=unclassified Streptomyces TaxID=2593676 RepID=UPI00344EA78C
MPYVITVGCVDVKDRACVSECPVDCIYEGRRSLYINPDECVDCGACEPVCPSDAIYYEFEVPEEHASAAEGNADFFRLPLHDGAPVGSPGGARHVRPFDFDTPHVSAIPVRRPTTP